MRPCRTMHHQAFEAEPSLVTSEGSFREFSLDDDDDKRKHRRPQSWRWWPSLLLTWRPSRLPSWCSRSEVTSASAQSLCLSDTIHLRMVANGPMSQPCEPPDLAFSHRPPFKPSQRQARLNAGVRALNGKQNCKLQQLKCGHLTLRSMHFFAKDEAR